MFTKILYINLEHRKDRNTHIQDQIKKINWTGEVERINAINGRNLNLEMVKPYFSARAFAEANNTKQFKFAPGSYMTRGSVGCALSHRDAWITILNGNHQKVLILEDDIYIDDNFNEKLTEYLTHIPDYDLLYVGYHESKTTKKQNNYYKIPTDTVFGTTGYIVDKRIVKKLIGMFPINLQLDSELSKIYKDIKIYHLNEELRLISSEHSFNNTFGSDVQVITGSDVPDTINSNVPVSTNSNIPVSTNSNVPVSANKNNKMIEGYENINTSDNTMLYILLIVIVIIVYIFYK